MRRVELRRWLAGTKVSGPARHVFMVLEYAHANDRRAWPSVSRLSTETGWSERTVQRALRELEVSGDLEVEEQKEGYPTVYRLVDNRGCHTVTGDTQSQRGATQSQRGDSVTPEGSRKVLGRRATAAALSTRASGGAANNGALTRDQATFLPGTGWVR